MTEDSHFSYFEHAICKLATEPDLTREKISGVRVEMDRSCDLGHITIRQWRQLLDEMAKVQSKLPVSERAVR